VYQTSEVRAINGIHHGGHEVHEGRDLTVENAKDANKRGVTTKVTKEEIVHHRDAEHTEFRNIS
jgi:hypothetical protein